ncbi:Uncharacterised protein [Serratia quinivorans]|uniref:hypothetical protein n=1 Tax=Serratia quinivorans TaxID=137545 RepID=UPI000D924C9C|nr:hypothetical protein [Serratia quinivorans]SPZ65445.1 Uncharacterised protein [Serratia quinivorans]VEI70629.1 Uncharacterised protein [Serratia quinivorans]
MEIFWIVVGVVAVIIFIISQNRTKVSDRTVVTHNRTIKTDDGEIRVQRTQVVDSSSTQYHKPSAASVASKAEYDLQAINEYYQQKANSPGQQKTIQEISPATDSLPIRVEPTQAAVSLQERKPAEKVIDEITPEPEAKKQCTRCRVNLPYSKFSRSSKHPDGVTIWCTDCLKGEKNTKHMKWCPVCKVRRKRTSFYPNNSNADGLMAWCKTCWDKRKYR